METQVHLESGALSATVSSVDPNGWCGLSNLRHRDLPLDWQLSPALTLEHYIGVPRQSSDYIEYEPTASPRSILPISPAECTLEYGPMPCCRVSCGIDYRMRSPHYVDVTIRASTGRSDWPMQSLALFFASIVRAPIYAGITIPGRDAGVEVKSGAKWLHFNGHSRIAGRTVHPAGVEHPELPRPTPVPQTYYYSDSSARFDDPFFFGVARGLGFALMFPRQRRREVRFTVNPIAPAFGGPAWDFFWIIDSPEAGRAYELSLRVMLKPFVGEEDMAAEYEAYASRW